MSFVIGFACGILAPWFVYRVKKMIGETYLFDEVIDEVADEIVEELVEEESTNE